MSLVEYHDPDNVFDVVAPYILHRLPLSNLHWKSATRPLRSIESLHVDFVCADGSNAPSAGLNKDAQPISDGPDTLHQSGDAAGGNLPKPVASAAKGQRHQIPGLRQTPYLKLYLVRCDDKETYKSKTKDILKAWIKDNTTPTSSTPRKTDDHDAFDWLILHVVLPNTAAASEPRWSKKNPVTDQDEPKERSSSNTRWTGKGSRTILERLRTDFNPSGKLASDRIAQIRPAKDNVPSHLFPADPPAGAAPLEETPQEHENACDDLISKMKTVILASFGLRVRQYEDDIKEKESQQSLPGWNFCTFFVLKEGLARAFESVGLVDDALAVYDELDAGLEVCLRDRALGQNTGQATSFPPFTPELHDMLVAVRNGDAMSAFQHGTFDIEKPLPLRSVDTDYRTKIVSNAISIFDFRRYIFAREMSLLLRLANIRSSPYPTHENGTISSQDLSSRREPSPQPGVVHNAIALAELCRRSVQYIPSIARILRADLRAGFSAEGADLDEAETVIDHAVSSVTFSFAEQILDETPISETTAALSGYETNGMDTSKRSDHRSMRRSSVPTISHASSGARGQGFAKFASILYSQGLKNISPIKNPELSNVAAYRAEIFLLQRRALQGAGRHFRFYIERESTNSDISEAEAANVTDTSSSKNLPGLSDSQLQLALSSAEEFSKMYEALTDQAACHYAAANRVKSSEKLTADIAKLKFAEGDYAAAALYFNQIIPSFSIQSWNSIETSILRSYAECLKALHRKDEYVRVLLSLLSRQAGSTALKSRRNSNNKARYTRRLARPSLTQKEEALLSQNNLFAELVSFAQDLPYDVTSPLQGYFSNLKINTSYKFFNDHDGFCMALTVQQLIADRVTLDRVTVRLVNPTDRQSREILLHNAEVVGLDSGESEIWLESRTSAVGQFIVDNVVFQAGRLSFVYEPLAQGRTAKFLDLKNNEATDAPESGSSASVLLYQRLGALYANLSSSKVTYIGKMRALNVLVDTGLNEIETASITLRSATAGLRIHSGEATITSGHASIVDKKQPGKIEIGALPSGTQILIKVPYDLERNVAELAIRLEVQYSTGHGDFIFVASPSVPIELPLDITVQDLFKERFFYSKFLIQPQSLIPIYLLDAAMRGSELYDAQALLDNFDPFMVFPHQPANVTYRISQNDAPKAAKPSIPKRSPLLLEVSYRSLQDDVFSSIVSRFKSAIEESHFNYLEPLLVQILNKSLHQHFPLENYQSSGLSGQVQIPKFTTTFWADVLDGLDETDRRALRRWLEQWHSQNPEIKIATPSDPEYKTTHPINKVLIDFEIPHLHYLHTTSLHLTAPPSKLNDRSTPVVRVGAVLHVQLRTRHTRRWDLRTGPPAAAGARDLAEAFTYEVRADPADWLVIGHQRASFTAAPDEAPPRAFELCLVPVRTGHLFLPLVEVWPARKQQQGQDDAATPGGAGSGNSGEAISSQTDCTSVHQSVVVVEGMQRTTVGVGKGDDLARGSALIWTELADADGLD